MRKSDEWWSNPAELLELDEAYRSRASRAFDDQTARMLKLKVALEREILTGRVDIYGHDVTENARAAYGVVMELLSVPERVKARRKWAEENIVRYRQMGPRAL